MIDPETFDLQHGICESDERDGASRERARSSAQCTPPTCLRPRYRQVTSHGLRSAARERRWTHSPRILAQVWALAEDAAVFQEVKASECLHAAGQCSQTDLLRASICRCEGHTVHQASLLRVTMDVPSGVSGCEMRGAVWEE